MVSRMLTRTPALSSALPQMSFAAGLVGKAQDRSLDASCSRTSSVSRRREVEVETAR